MNKLPIIRKAKAGEAETLTALAIRSKAHWGYSQAFLEACRAELTVTDNKLSSEKLQYYVAERGSDLQGYYAIEKLTDREYELEALFVEPVLIGNGVGRALIEHAKLRIKELGGIKLVIQGDPNAERFYRAAGGVQNGTRESASISGRRLPLFTVDLASENAP